MLRDGGAQPFKSLGIFFSSRRARQSLAGVCNFAFCVFRESVIQQFVSVCVKPPVEFFADLMLQTVLQARHQRFESFLGIINFTRIFGEIGFNCF
ncbi:hypothetical protein [Methylocystis rosea]|uniref:hypothetical protein n=1 Tax=Methylocystis rosea TaxID=173366 RepID=UPI001FE191C1|nr:hypothetical protein [Methylocystis rosea]